MLSLGVVLAALDLAALDLASFGLGLLLQAIGDDIQS
jgi:hypothetical protein